MAGHIIPKKTYFLIFALLMILLVATVWVAYLHFESPFNVIVPMTIAVIKSVLVILYFMHVRYSGRLTWVFVFAAIFWLLIMIAITMGDYVSRDWLPGGWQLT